MQSLWQDIMVWFKDHAKPCYDNLLRVSNGADDAQLAELETALGKSVPEDFKDYLRLYNKSYQVVFFEYTSLNIRTMLKRRAGLNQQLDAGIFENHEVFPDIEKIRCVKWHPNWLPFAEDGGGNLLCLDLDPPADGDYGQVFSWETRGDPGSPNAKSFLAFVTDYRDALLSGKYRYDEASGIFDNLQG